MKKRHCGRGGLHLQQPTVQMHPCTKGHLLLVIWLKSDPHSLSLIMTDCGHLGLLFTSKRSQSDWPKHLHECLKWYSSDLVLHCQHLSSRGRDIWIFSPLYGWSSKNTGSYTFYNASQKSLDLSRAIFPHLTFLDDQIRYSVYMLWLRAQSIHRPILAYLLVYMSGCLLYLLVKIL